MDHISRLLTPQGFDLGDFSKTIFITTPQDTNWDFFAKLVYSLNQKRAVTNMQVCIFVSLHPTPCSSV
jgi:hypothetical protein